jgi:predicted small lipoprotein YifL
MRVLKICTALAIMLGLAGCASDGPSYAGQDAGFLVASIGCAA